MTTKREQILANLAAAMAGINGVSPFETTVKKTDRDFLPPERLHSSDYPAVFVTGAEEPKDYGVYKQVRAKLVAEVRGFVKRKLGTDLSTTVNALLGDVERAALLDPKRGGLALDTRPLDAQVDEISFEDLGGFVMRLEVDYFYDAGSP